MFYLDTTYLLWVLLPTVVISGAVQLYLRSTYATWRQRPNSRGMTGVEVGETLFEHTSLKAIPLESTPGELSDRFDPRANVVRLSKSVSSQPSVASMAIVAHELGHVQQQQSGSALMAARDFLVPAVTVSPTLSYIAIFAGFILNMTGLIWVGILLFGLMVLFCVFTLPVEIDASRRGLRLLAEAGLMASDDDRAGAHRVLTAAGLTYLAAAVTAVLQLLYFVTLAQRR
jgi:uncharacterized protein